MTPVERVSVVLTTRNRAPILARTLERIGELDTTGFALQVVVADNGSTDGTGATIEAARARFDLVSCHVPEPGKNRALNRALELVDGTLVVFTDDDVIPALDWLTALVAASARWPDAEVFGGRILLAAPPGAPDEIFASREWAVNFGRYHPQETEGVTERSPYGGNYAVRGTLLERLSFDEGVGPDATPHYAMGSESEFLGRARADGVRMVYVPTARVWHIVRPEQLRVDALAERSYRIGRGWARLQGPDPSVPQLMGAPRWLWREWLSAAVPYALGRLTPGGPSWEAVLKRRRLAGILDEYRGRLRSSRRSG